MVFGARDLTYWVLGPSGNHSGYLTGPLKARSGSCCSRPLPQSPSLWRSSCSCLAQRATSSSEAKVKRAKTTHATTCQDAATRSIYRKPGSPMNNLKDPFKSLFNSEQLWLSSGRLKFAFAFKGRIHQVSFSHETIRRTADPAGQYIYIYSCVHTHTYTHTYINYLPTYIHTYIHKYIHTYLHTYVRACVRTYIHTCIHKYIHTYIHIHTKK